MKRPATRLEAVVLTLAAQALLAAVAVSAWTMLDDGVRPAGKVLAGVAGAVSAFAAVALLVPLARAVRRREVSPAGPR